MASLPFQTQVFVTPAQALPGDVVQTTFLAEAVSPQPQGYRADTGGVTIAGFAWETNGDATLASTGAGAPVGFIPRQLNVGAFDDTTTGYGWSIPAGREVKAYNRGAFYAIGTTTATDGLKVFAVLATGALKFAAAGTTVAGAVETVFYVKPLNGTATAPIGSLVMITSQPTA